MGQTVPNGMASGPGDSDHEMTMEESSTVHDSDPTHQEEVDRMPEPHIQEDIWMASCRLYTRMSQFSQEFLLFKPDARLFCCQGLDCKSPIDSKHREFYIHASVKAIRLAAKQDLERNGAMEVVNMSAEKQRHVDPLPYIRKCWLLPEAPGPDVSYPGELQGRTALVYVHGFKSRYFTVMETAHHLQRLLAQADLAGNGTGFVLPLLWPCHNRVTSYGKARRKSDDVAVKLRQLLRMLYSLECNVVVVGHSLGCRVALAALSGADGDESPLRGRAKLCSHLILLAPAVENNALSEEGTLYPRSKVSAQQITVFNSRNDDILGSVYNPGEAISGCRGSLMQLVTHSGLAMGMVGLESPAPKDTRSVDVSEFVHSHKPVFWFAAKRVRETIIEALEVKQPSLTLPHVKAESLGTSAAIAAAVMCTADTFGDQWLEHHYQDGRAPLDSDSSGEEGMRETDTMELIQATIAAKVEKAKRF